ncbi:S8 family serine peptidase [Methanosarcina sp. KYL-1]|uniref:S8 family serine peptidase n=1 Tax=Methanosarcina sp. KYL-1 TaxID=2602068 RepID=UPI0021018D37|nr:S8 family serine peptidase [Methanosarcina sp. KYL-1]MCQ1535690.1 S8 family serine peptidase [Methanosarcina sp. KYL-1]
MKPGPAAGNVYNFDPASSCNSSANLSQKIPGENNSFSGNFKNLSELSNLTYVSSVFWNAGAGDLSPARKKLSSDLLQLTDSSFLPEGCSQEELKVQMEYLKQMKRSGEPGGEPEVETGVGAGGEPGREPGEEPGGEPGEGHYDIRDFNGGSGSGELVHVYVQFSSGSTHAADSYVSGVTGRDEANGLLSAWVETGNLEPLASLETVRCIRPVMPPVVRAGPVVTEGDMILRSAEVRRRSGLTGEGIKIGVISDGVDSFSEAVAAGELPSDVQVLSNTEGGDEGTAMLEIIHDLAPGAELYFHDAGNSTIAFNGAVDELAAAGCDIICDDIGWIFEPFFEDGIVASHVREEVERRGILYVSAAGNSAQAHYQGEYQPHTSGFHDFSGGEGNLKELYVNLPPGGLIVVVLEWNDSWNASSNNYDLFLAEVETGDLLAASTFVQDGNASPLEYVAYTNVGPDSIDAAVLVRKVSGQAKVLEVYMYPFGAVPYANNLVENDSIFGHPAAPGVISVGAIDAADPENDEIEPYSSRGPVSIYYPAFELRQKPDVCGVDGVKVSGSGGFSSGFFGTSASAPHIAGLAGLIWSGYPEKPGTEIRASLLETALGLGAPVPNNVFGYGRADALSMYLGLLPPLPAANFTANRTSGSAPLTVQFTDLSENVTFPENTSLENSTLYENSTLWEWDVDGDSVPDYSIRNPVHTYTQPGSYNVTLTVSNAAGQDTLTKPGYITVLSPVAEGERLLLYPGWNLISVPYFLKDASAAHVLEGVDYASLLYYDAGSGAWETPLTLEPLKAYWLRVNATEALTVPFERLERQPAEVPVSPPSIRVYKGWNAIGCMDPNVPGYADPNGMISAELALKNIDSSYVCILGPWDPVSKTYVYRGCNGKCGMISGKYIGTDVFEMEPYRGYWVFAVENATLAGFTS